MNDYFVKLFDLETKIYRDYFLNEYIPKNDILNKVANGNSLLFQDLFEINKDPIINRLENELKQKYKFPFKILTLIIFYYIRPQQIHIDGSKNFVYTSLNLPLINYENSKIVFYKTQQSTNYSLISNARYFNEDEATPIIELPGSNEWVLINTNTPHKVMSDIKNPRITLCIRFVGNPKLEHFLNILNKG